MTAENQALKRMVPIQGSAVYAPQETAFTGTSTTAVALPGASASGQGDGFYVRLLPTEDCRIVFGGLSMTAALGTDLLLIGGAVEDFWVPAGITHFRVIRDPVAATNGTLTWQRNS